MSSCWGPISLAHWLACEGAAFLLLLGRTGLHWAGKRSHGHGAGACCRQAWALSCSSRLAPSPPSLRKHSWHPAPSWVSSLFVPMLPVADTGCPRHGLRPGQDDGDQCPRIPSPASKDLQPPPEAEVVPRNGRASGRLLLPAHVQLRE